MSLEAKIEALTEQVTQLTYAVTVLKNVFMNQKGKAPGFEEAKKAMDVTGVTAAVEKAIEKQTALAKQQAEEGNAKPSTTTDTSPPSSNESRTVTYDDVKNVTIAVSKIDKAKAVAGLARFGVQTAKSLTEDQWLDYVVYMEKVAAGEIDPEASHE